MNGRKNYASLVANEKEVKFLPGAITFIFGAGMNKKIPCVIGGLKATIWTEVVGSGIPLLLMKRMGFKLNMENDTLEFNGKSVELTTTSSRHSTESISGKTATSHFKPLFSF